MDIKNNIIGPNFSIDPGVIIIPVDGVNFPSPGISAVTRELVLLVGENYDAALGIKHCTNLYIKGKTGSNPTAVSCVFKNGEYNVKGSFAENFGDYFIIPIENGYILKGQLGTHRIDLRTNLSKSFVIFTGTIDGVKADVKLSDLTPSTYGLRGDIGEKKLNLTILFEEERITIKGNNEDHCVDYSITSSGDKIEMKGITKDNYSTMIFSLLSDSELRAAGKPGKVPVDYKISLLENGAAICGNTGFYQANYTFISDRIK